MQEDEEAYNLEEEYKDEPGAETVDAKIIDKSIGKEKWIAALKKEMNSLKNKVFEVAIVVEARAKYEKRGRR